MRDHKAIIIGAGPAGLTAAYELLTRTHIKPIVVERSNMVGGIACTVNYKGNRIDIGGHRFFSKSDRVMQWWANLLPVQQLGGEPLTISYQGKQRTVDTADHRADPEKTDKVMLVRPRKSRIYFLRKFFDYPISLNKNTIRNLGLLRVLRIGFSYVKARLFVIRNEQTLEQFLINRFGKILYLTFFKSYTEKVWGVPCQEISAAWGAQRIKGLSISTAVWHALKKPFNKQNDVAQKGTETSLIEQFLYPKFGPGQMWETCTEKITAMGGQVILNVRVEYILKEDNTVTAVVATDEETGKEVMFKGDYFFSTMPIKDLIRGLGDDVPRNIREISEGLIYRDFITVGLLLSELKIHEDTDEGKKLLKDNWLYIQEPDVRVGRIQIFNNWSPYMVADPSKVWIGLEYFCYETDDLWKLSNDEMVALGAQELAKIGIIDTSNVLDSTVIRMPKAYPAYFGSYDRFDELRQYLDSLENLYLIGRNGMHRYNNQDHSMLTAMMAVDNIIAGQRCKSNIWDVNIEQDYHETKDNSLRPIKKPIQL